MVSTVTLKQEGHPLPTLVFSTLLGFFSEFKDIHVKFIGDSKLGVNVNGRVCTMPPKTSQNLKKKYGKPAK